MHETRNRKVHHTLEETTQWTLVHSAKERANKAQASTERAKAKGARTTPTGQGQEQGQEQGFG